jgi:GMP reductase
MHIESGTKLDYGDVLIKPKRSTLNSRSDVDITRTFKFPHTGKTWTGVPLMAANMDGVGTFSMAKVLQKHRMMTVMRKHYTVQDWHQCAGGLDWDYIVACTGTNAIFDADAADYKLLKLVCEAFPIKHICIDVANGYQQNFIDFCARVREEFPDKTLIAGNVCTPEVVEELIMNSGVDVVKVGIGPGGVCTTRIVTGVGYPQLSAVAECADIAHQHKGMVVADGGCSTPGDVMKAIGGGADFVMLGSMLAFHEESEELIDPQGNISFYGMSSNDAMGRHGARKDGYRTAEGKTATVPCRGPVEPTVSSILGGLRSGCTYIGAEKLKEVSRRTTFVKVSRTHNRVFGDE